MDLTENGFETFWEEIGLYFAICKVCKVPGLEYISSFTCLSNHCLPCHIYCLQWAVLCQMKVYC